MRPLFFLSIAMKTMSIGSSLKKTQPLNCGFAVTREPRDFVAVAQQPERQAARGEPKAVGWPHWQASPGLWLRLTRSDDAMDGVAPDRMTLRRNQEREAIGMPHTPGYQLNKTSHPRPRSRSPRRPNPRPCRRHPRVRRSTGHRGRWIFPPRSHPACAGNKWS